MHSKPTPRRRHSAELRAQVLAQCAAPGASVAAVAQAHGLNANLVHKWRRAPVATKQSSPVVRRTEAAQKITGAFIPLDLSAALQATSAAMPDIRIEMRRGATTLSIAWPVEAAGACAALLQELLR